MKPMSSSGDSGATVYGDPNAVIARHTAAGSGGAANFDIYDAFRQFGYYPTQEEIDAIAPSFAGRTNPGQIGMSAVSQYVLHKKTEIDRQKNDPLVALQKRMEDSAGLMKNQVTGLYGQLQDVLGSAPQLFGNLTPDQISTYLAPLQTAFKEQMAVVQGTMASRGIAASSTENNALAQTGEQFQENVLSTGLNVGMQSQQAKAQAISKHISDLLGLTGTEEQIAGGAAGQRSAQDLGQSNMIASLPFFLNQASLQQELIQKQMNSGGGFMDTFGKVTSGINQGMNALQSLMMIPQQFKTSSTAPSYSPGPMAPGGGGFQNFMGSSSYQAPNLSLYNTPEALFASPVA